MRSDLDGREARAARRRARKRPQVGPEALLRHGVRGDLWPSRFTATTGRPAAIASRTTMPKGSPADGRQRIELSARTSFTALCGTGPAGTPCPHSRRSRGGSQAMAEDLRHPRTTSSTSSRWAAIVTNGFVQSADALVLDQAPEEGDARDQSGRGQTSYLRRVDSEPDNVRARCVGRRKLGLDRRAGSPTGHRRVARSTRVAASKQRGRDRRSHEVSQLGTRSSRSDAAPGVRKRPKHGAARSVSSGGSGTSSLCCGKSQCTTSKASEPHRAARTRCSIAYGRAVRAERLEPLSIRQQHELERHVLPACRRRRRRRPRCARAARARSADCHAIKPSPEATMVGHERGR